MNRRTRVGAAVAVAAVLALSGCSGANDGLASQYEAADDKGYIAGDGSVTEVAEADRGDAIVFAGTGERGEAIDSADYAGDVVVVNFWYAGCAPCRAEAPQLKSLSEKYLDAGARFVGVNVYDQPDTALAFSEDYGIEYPSVIDVNDGAARLAFTGTVPPKAVPTTIVLDKEGRVAARILGQLKDESILDTLIRDTIDE
ncbi:TlpA family protein disulfide reductase [Mycetocola reblochoni]|uniref:Thiol:disulfide oxidoreductase related to ResA n=2 Tax=Mycetocola reblochoni TaxID=331618 RepID=A0A1R4IXH5_9MICO|nr:TlpA disulfide reductase family protein [Mycetocola reblochoni]RLP70933.1 TlpA family protein disulfide reductase [Mycetocola reblochoni]SJN24399.1 Thiol:disulfide oxidoreductase related to ResA [Mycetocola reblochoni REB411]